MLYKLIKLTKCIIHIMFLCSFVQNMAPFPWRPGFSFSAATDSSAGGRVPPKSACWFTALVFMGWGRVSWPCDKRQPAAWKRPSRRPPGFPAEMHPKWNPSGGFEVQTNNNESVSRDLRRQRRIKQTHSVILVSVADPLTSPLPPALQTYLRRARLYWNSALRVIDLPQGENLSR